MNGTKEQVSGVIYSLKAHPQPGPIQMYRLFLFNKIAQKIKQKILEKF